MLPTVTKRKRTKEDAIAFFKEMQEMKKNKANVEATQPPPPPPTNSEAEKEAEQRQQKVLIVKQPAIYEEAGIQMYAFDLKDAPEEMLDAVYANRMETCLALGNNQIWLSRSSSHPTKPIIEFHNWFGWINVFCASKGKNCQDKKAFDTSDLEEMQEETDICWNYISSKMNFKNTYRFWEPTKFIAVYQVINHCS